jgi:hypothetical protein
VTWTCTAGADCTRQVAGGAAVTLIAAIVSACFDVTSSASCASSVSATNPGYVWITMQPRIVSQLPNANRSAVAGTSAPTLKDGVALRDFS